MGKQRFSIAPARAAFDQDLSDSVFRTLCALGIYGDKDGWCFPSQSTLADDRGLSRKTINVHIKELRNKEYLNLIYQFDEDTGAQKNNLYQIRFDYPPVTSRGYTPCNPLEVTPPVTSKRLHITPQDNAPVKRKNSSSKNGRGRVTPYITAMQELEQHFSKELPCPAIDWNKHDKRYLQRRWRSPMKRIWETALKDTEIAKRAVTEAIKSQKQKRLTMDAPQSIEKSARSWIAYNGTKPKVERMTREELLAQLERN